MLDSIEQEVFPGDLCIVPWKSSKVCLGFYSHETASSYIFTSKRLGVEVLVIPGNTLRLLYSIAGKYGRHFIKVDESQLDKYIEC